jgi:hypothetical protein
MLTPRDFGLFVTARSAPIAGMSGMGGYMIYDDLHQACAHLGTRLFTITLLDTAAGLARRAYSSDPVAYPVSGTKPLTEDGWYAACITGRSVFVANTVPEFALYFTDHALITSLGLGSCINIPVYDGRGPDLGPVLGPVLGTVNLLAEEQHFNPARLAQYQAVMADRHAALVAAMAAPGAI